MAFGDVMLDQLVNRIHVLDRAARITGWRRPDQEARVR